MTVSLPTSVARCRPSAPGAARDNCARYAADIPPGAPLRDFSLPPAVGCARQCSGFMSIEALQALLGEATPPAVKPWPAA